MVFFKRRERERESGDVRTGRKEEKKMMLGDKGEDMSWDTGLHVHTGG